MFVDAPARPVRLLTAIEYFRDQRPWRSEHISRPSWPDVEFAVRRMDNYGFPSVQLNCTDDEENEDTFHIVGGSGRYAMFQLMGEWEFSAPAGTDEPAHLWESDQGYDCKERNILTDIERVLRIAKRFYDTGSYAQLACG